MEFLQTSSPETRILLLTILVGALMNLFKRTPVVPSKWVPLASVALAFTLTWVYSLVFNLTFSGSLDLALQAVATGLMPAGAHKLAKPIWTALLGEESANRWMGQADASDKPKDDEEPPTPKAPPSAVMMLTLAGLFVACTPAQAQKFADFADSTAAKLQVLDSSIQFVESGADAYFDRHPSPVNSGKLREAIAIAKASQVALTEVLATAKAMSQADIDAAIMSAVAAYEALYNLATSLGVLEAIPPEGGAENELAPSPIPIDVLDPPSMRSLLESA